MHLLQFCKDFVKYSLKQVTVHMGPPITGALRPEGVLMHGALLGRTGSMLP